MFQKYLRNSTEKVIQAINIGTMELANFQQPIFTPEFILLGLLEQEDSGIMRILEEIEMEPQTVADTVIEKIYTLFPAAEEQPSLPTEITLSPDVERLLEIASQESKELHDKFITTESLFLAFLHKEIAPSCEILSAVGLSYEKCKAAVFSIRNGMTITARDGESQENVLDVFGTDLTELAQQGKLDPIVGREEDIERIVEILARRVKNNPVIIGEPGVGKTVLVEGLAQLIAAHRVPQTLQSKKIIQLDIVQLTAGTKFKGEFEERMKAIVDALENAGGRVIAFIDEIQTLMDSSAGSIKMSDILKPALARGQIQLIGTATCENYKRTIEKDRTFSRCFQVVRLKEPSIEESVKILKGISEKYSAHHEVIYEDRALEAAVKLSSRYISERFLPDKAIDLLDEAGACKKIFLVSTHPEVYHLETQLAELRRERTMAFSESAGSGGVTAVVELQMKVNEIEAKLKKIRAKWKEEQEKSSNIVTAEDVAVVVSKITGVPVNKVVETEAKKLVTMEDVLHKRIIGQDSAVTAVSNAIRRNRAGIKDAGRPIGIFLFFGPTGVGKTEFAKVLADFLFDDETKIVRLDMSEYMERHSVSKMIGSPPGYVGYDDGGQLTEQIRRNPYSVVLLDEMEKANEEVFNLMLQIFDEGKLTDSQGVEVSFRNTIIIGTSNLGSSKMFDLGKRIGFAGTPSKSEDYGVMKEKILEETKKFFKPEFLNRVDEIIVFHSLEKEHILSITKLLLEKLRRKIEDVGYKINFDDNVCERIAQLGYSPEFGARPLRRVIENHIENAISFEIICGNIKPGKTINVSVKNDDFCITSID